MVQYWQFHEVQANKKTELIKLIQEGFPEKLKELVKKVKDAVS